MEYFTDYKNRELIKHYKETKSERTLLKLIEGNKGFIYATSLKFGGDHETNLQNMKIGFVKAIEKFDLERKDLKFLSFAIYQLMGTNTEFNRMTYSEKKNSDCNGLNIILNGDERERYLPSYDNTEYSLDMNNLNIDIKEAIRKSRSFSDMTIKIFDLYRTGYYTQTDIAKIMECSQENVRQILVRFKTVLRERIDLNSYLLFS